MQAAPFLPLPAVCFLLCCLQHHGPSPAGVILCFSGGKNHLLCISVVFAINSSSSCLLLQKCHQIMRLGCFDSTPNFLQYFELSLTRLEKGVGSMAARCQTVLFSTLPLGISPERKESERCDLSLISAASCCKQHFRKKDEFVAVVSHFPLAMHGST